MFSEIGNFEIDYQVLTAGRRWQYVCRNLPKQERYIERQMRRAFADAKGAKVTILPTTPDAQGDFHCRCENVGTADMDKKCDTFHRLYEEASEKYKTIKLLN